MMVLVCSEKTKFLNFKKWCAYIFPQLWGKSHWNQFWDGAPSSGRAHLLNVRKIANSALSQESLKVETWFMA